MLTGQNGILNRAGEAKEKTDQSQKDEKIKLAVMSSLGTNGLIDINQLKTEIENQGGTISGTTFPVAVINGKNSYQIDQYGNINEQTQPENIEKNWTMADITNTNDDWYAYKDATGNKATVNTPKLANGMTAIKYEAEEVTGSKWANATTKDGSMWVWIPRYAYKITYKEENNKSAGGTIDIAFLKGTTNTFLDSSITGDVKTSIKDVTYTTNSDGTKSQDQWLLEPAFTFGDEDIEGFWFAKFEASNTDEYGDDASTSNDSNLTMQIKPNVKSWRNITSANIFTACLNLTSDAKYKTYFNNVGNVDTHMTKNVEWGAVAYLTHSKYGLDGKEICINTNNSYLTGVGSGSTSSTTSVTDKYDTANGVTASTTKNVYGIYDMSGGAYEYVAGCYTGRTAALTSNTNYTGKYIDVYSAYDSTKYGDAIFETSNGSGNTSWFLDGSYIIYNDYPVFGRGGNYNEGTGAGLFNFSNINGGAGGNLSFRPVCIVK